MAKKLFSILFCAAGLIAPHTKSTAQITLARDYKNYTSAFIGTFQGINFRESGFSGMYPVPGTSGREFWICSDRGVNVDAANANISGCRPTYDKIYSFPSYAPKIHRVRLNGDSVQILQTITIKRPGGTNASGIINPTGFGSTSTEVASTDTVMNCANFSAKTTPKDVWGIDAEGLAVDRDGNFWVCEEGGPTIWKLNQNGVVLKRYSPYANLVGAEPQDVLIDTAFKYRKNNRGFEGISIAPNGKVYAIIQSPILYPTKAVGEGTRVHRILEIDPITNATRMFVYLNDGIIGASGSNQIRLRDWKIGDMAAINDTTFLVLEAALRGTTDIKRVYKINITGATNVNSGLYSGVTLEALVDSAGLAANGVVPVKKTLFMDLLANGWDPILEKAEGLSILNDSTIFISNDNDYGQVSLPENGIASATGIVGHVVRFNLQGANKLNNFVNPAITLSMGVTGPSTSQTPYMTGTVPGARFTSIITAGESASGYKMSGLADGLGAFDNHDGTFTLLMNHEFGNSIGVTRAHGSKGAFVSKWIINKSNLSIASASDLMRTVNIWDRSTSTFTAYNAAFPSTLAAINRFCSADLPEISAFYNARTGKGTMERIFMNGEEAGNEGRAFGSIATGPNTGVTYELPYLGKFSWENSVASPLASDTTVVIGLDDATPGQVYVYVGTKSSVGNEITKAGLNNGHLFGVAVSGIVAEVSDSVPSAGTAFSLIDLGDVHNTTGAALNTASNTAGVTTFLRPEDGVWDPKNHNDFYFLTTNSFTNPSRLWRLRFTDAANPAIGGTITALLDGTEGPKMMDNLTIDNYGHLLIQEDPGGNAYIAKIWQYNIATDALTLVASHDSTRFLPGGANFLTIDEESSGIIDMESILGPGMFLVADQAHYTIPGEVAEGGQLLAFYNPATFNSAPEAQVTGSGMVITDGDATPSTTDNTDFGNVYTGAAGTQTFVIENNGAGNLVVSNIHFTGAHSSDFSLVSAPIFPVTVASGATLTVTAQFAPMVDGIRTAMMHISSNDFDEAVYDYAVRGNGVDSPEIHVQGNTIDIVDGDMTPGTANNTDFGSTTLGGTIVKNFVIKNSGLSNMVVSDINITGAAAADFALVGTHSFPHTIAVADSYSFSMSFMPSVAGLRGAIVNVSNNDFDEATFDYAIQGTGVALPEIAVKGNGIWIADGDATAGTANNTDLGNVLLGADQTKTFVIHNQGMGMLNISDINFSGAHAIEFTLVSPPTFPVMLGTDDSLVINVKFAPLGVGERNGHISILNNDADEAAFDFALQGTGVGLAEINLQGNGITIFDGDATPGTANNTHFGNVPLNVAATRTFAVQNTGDANLVVTGIIFSGFNAREYSLMDAPDFPVTIASGANELFNVRFVPTGVGPRRATISIGSNDADENVYNFELEGNGRNITGLTMLNAGTSVSVYPNPVADEAVVAFSLTNDSKVAVRVVDVQGKEVVKVADATMKAGDRTMKINTSDLANGIYFVKITDGTATTNIKLVVMH